MCLFDFVPAAPTIEHGPVQRKFRMIGIYSSIRTGKWRLFAVCPQKILVTLKRQPWVPLGTSALNRAAGCANPLHLSKQIGTLRERFIDPLLSSFTHIIRDWETIEALNFVVTGWRCREHSRKIARSD